MDGEHLRFALCETFEQAAAWRSMMRDSRSREAAKIFKRMIATAGLVEERTLLTYLELWKLAADKASHSALVRAVGFGFWPDSASDFVARFIAEWTGGHAR